MDGVSSEYICIEDMMFILVLEVMLIEDVDRYVEIWIDNEGKLLGFYKMFNDEGVNDSLIFIGIIWLILYILNVYFLEVEDRNFIRLVVL